MPSVPDSGNRKTQLDQSWIEKKKRARTHTISQSKNRDINNYLKIASFLFLFRTSNDQHFLACQIKFARVLRD
jgi:hypothetical protein